MKENGIVVSHIGDGSLGQGVIYEALNMGLHNLLQSDRWVQLIGEDIADDYCGAFKVTQGLAESHGNGVRPSGKQKRSSKIFI